MSAGGSGVVQPWLNLFITISFVVATCKSGPGEGRPAGPAGLPETQGLICELTWNMLCQKKETFRDVN